MKLSVTSTKGESKSHSPPTDSDIHVVHGNPGRVSPLTFTCFEVPSGFDADPFANAVSAQEVRAWPTGPRTS